MSEGLKIPLGNLEDWLEHELAPVMGPIKAEGKSLLSDVRGRLNEFSEVCERLMVDSEKEMVKESRKTYRSARAANKLAQDSLEAVDKIDVPEEVSRENLGTLNENLRKLLTTVEMERRMMFPSIEPYFILDRRRFDIAFKRVIEAFKALQTFSLRKYVKAETLEEAVSTINRLTHLLNKVEKAKTIKVRMELRKKILEEKITEKQREITAVQDKGEMRDLVQLNVEIQELERKVKNSLRHLQKPFIKFQSLARGPGFAVTPDELKKLDEYLNDPFNALAAEEEGYPMLKSVIRKMGDAMSQGKLKLKSSRLRKAQEQIREALEKDTLIPLHHECREAFSKRQQLLTSEALAALQNELTKYREELKELQRRKEFLESKHAALDKVHQELLQKIENQRKELEKTILGLTGKKVTVTITL
jgi:predicted  nucleic acid-binding Zn-ribbon protein